MDAPKISVVVCAFNGEKFIAEAIQSILNQTIKPYEIIVVNDGSTDQTLGQLSPFKDLITLIDQENQGLPSARNNGIKAAKGNLMAFLDQDDFFPEDAFKSQLEAFAEYKTARVVFGHTQLTKEGVVVLNPEDSVLLLLMGCTMIEKSVFDEVGVFDPSMLMGEDVDMFLRINEAKIPMAIHDKVVMNYRRHGENLTANSRKTQLYFIRAIKKAHDRRKKLNLPATDLQFKNINDAIKKWHTAK